MTRTGKRLLLAVALLPGPIARASAQGPAPPVEDVAAPEVFGHVGVFRAVSDESKIGTGPSYGGVITARLGRWIAFDVDVQTGSVQRSHTASLTEEISFQTRRTLLIPSLLYRFGDEELYYFVGGGVGAEFWTGTLRQQGLPPPPGRLPPPGVQFAPGTLHVSHSSGLNPKISFRAGFARFFTRHLGLRGDAFIAGWHLGARVGVGYRFD